MELERLLHLVNISVEGIRAVGAISIEGNASTVRPGSRDEVQVTAGSELVGRGVH